MPVKKEIIYPLFLECCQFTEDIFWENIFEDLAYGITPYGTYINKGFLCCNYKDKEFSYKIEKKDSEVLYNDIYNLLAKKMGLLSQQDKLKKKIDFSLMEDEIKEYRKSWSNIRKKNIKDLLIENYVIEMKHKYCLTIKQARDLLSQIFIAMVFKTINIKNINYEDGKIISIDGIKFSKKKVIFEKNIYGNELFSTPFIVIDKNLMSDNWEKYLLNIQKY
jgi:hypothetical protein